MPYSLTLKNAKSMTIEGLPESPVSLKKTFLAGSTLMTYSEVEAALILTLAVLAVAFLMDSSSVEVRVLLGEKISGYKSSYHFKRSFPVAMKRCLLAIPEAAHLVKEPVLPLGLNHVPVRVVMGREV